MSSNNVKYPDIPHRTEGGSHDTVSIYCANSVETAIDYYEKLKARFKSVNEWHAFSDKVKAEFSLFNGRTALPIGRFEKGNLIRIDVPGIGNPSGGGYDWTEIVDIQTGGEEWSSPFLCMTLRPCPAPGSHFYSGYIYKYFCHKKGRNMHLCGGPR